MEPLVSLWLCLWLVMWIGLSALGMDAVLALMISFFGSFILEFGGIALIAWLESHREAC